MSDGGVMFAIMTAPHIHPVHPVESTGPVITDTNRRHREEVRVFRKYNNTDADLKHQLLGAIDNNYVAKLKHANIGYTNIITLGLLSHICNHNGAINPEMMDANAETTKQPWACGSPFMKLTTKIEDKQAYAKAGNYDMLYEQIPPILFKLVTNTKQLDQTSTKWHNKAASDKYWAKFKKNFSDIHCAWKTTQTTGSAGFNKTKNLEQALDWDHQGTNSVIDNLAPPLQTLHKPQHRTSKSL